MGLKFKTSSAANDALAQLMQLAQLSQKRKTTELNKQASEINSINIGLNSTSDKASLDNITNVLNINSGNYTDPVTKTLYENLKRKTSIKTKKIEYYQELTDDMAKKYIGGEGHKGYQNLDKNDFKYWTYDYISKELQGIRDFEVMTSDEDYSINDYDNANIKTIQLKDRLNQYKNKLLTGLEATKGDNLITDNELIYILSGDEAGLKAARTSNLASLTTQKNSNSRAISAIKSNIAKLRTYNVKESLKATSDGKPWDDSTAIEDYGIANYDALYSKYELDWYREGGNEALSDYVARKFNEDRMKRPDVLILEWQNELQGYEGFNEKIDTEIVKWKSQDLSGFDVPIDKESLQLDMEASVFGKTDIEMPEKLEDIPLDLSSVMYNDEAYYSPSTGKYYDKKKVNEITGY